MSDLKAALGEALGSLYRVEREVRPVGPYRQFVVTQVTDGPALLVKVLPTADSLAIDADKFERDLLLLADKLRQSNLVAPKGGGRAGAFIYHTRPFIEGTTLHAWMAKNGQPSLARAVEILRGILSGLAHAHKNKVAHGDLRAECILLGTHTALVADVGIKKVLGGVALARNDMAALGVLMHEILTGTAHHAMDEPVEANRSLPPWLSDWLRTQWTEAGSALAALKPPPPPSMTSRSKQPYA